MKLQMFNLGRYFLPPAKSTFAHNVDGLFNFITDAGALLLLGILVVMVYFVIKYRRRSEDDVTSLVDHNTLLEISWIVLPLFLVLVIFSWGFKGYYILFHPPKDAYEINVTAQQWLWKFHYKNGKTTVNKLYVPAGEPVKLIMTSKDVIHSLFIPDFRVKHDVLPDRYTQVWFNAKKPGHAELFCAQYCGVGHSNMHADVIIQSQKKFKEWLKNGGSNSTASSGGKPNGKNLAALGKKLYTSKGCNSCHSVNGSKGVGPTWKGLFGSTVTLSNGQKVKANADYIKDSILHPKKQIVKGFQPVMPKGIISKKQNLNALVAYIKSLSPKAVKKTSQSQQSSQMSQAKMIALGKKLYKQKTCSSCHTLNGSKSVGPTWKGLYGSMVTLKSGKKVKANANYIKESIMKPKAQVVKGFQPIMPTGLISKKQNLNALVAYIKSLK